MYNICLTLSHKHLNNQVKHCEPCFVFRLLNITLKKTAAVMVARAILHRLSHLTMLDLAFTAIERMWLLKFLSFRGFSLWIGTQLLYDITCIQYVAFGPIRHIYSLYLMNNPANPLIHHTICEGLWTLPTLKGSDTRTTIWYDCFIAQMYVRCDMP